MVVLDIGTPPSGFLGWEMHHVRVHGFADLPATSEIETLSPEFTCFGHQWRLVIYPGGHRDSKHGMSSVYLENCSNESMEIRCGFIVRDVNNRRVATSRPFTWTFDRQESRYGFRDFVNRSAIVNALVEGTLVIEVRMKLTTSLPSLPFTPRNPFCDVLLNTFNDEDSADVVFEIQDEDGEHQGRKTRSSISKAPHVDLFAHRLILQKCAPDLAEVCRPGRDLTRVPITDVKPEVFRHMLHYLYGGSVPEEDLKSHAKEIIDVTDRFGVVHLKLDAEASYVTSTTICIDNVMENLLYADAKNCALLKEAAMDFIVENGVEVLEKVSLKDVPGAGPTLFADLLTAMSRGKKKTADGDQFSTMRVSELRKKLEEKGLDIDGSRETMIATLSANA